MRAYRVQLGAKVSFEPNQTEARTKRQELETATGTRRGAGTVEEVEIPTGKSDLLPWLNKTIDGILNKLGEGDNT